MAKTIGTLTVGVKADAKGLSNEVKAAVVKAEKDAPAVKVGVDLDTKKAEAAANRLKRTQLNELEKQKRTIQLDANISKAEAQLKKLGNAADVLAKQKAKEIADAFSNIGTKLSIGVSAPVLAGFAAAAKAASDLGESVNKSQVIFGTASKDVEAFAGTATKGFGLSKQAAIDFAGSFGAFTRLLGDSQKSAQASIELTKRAADIASLFNVSQEQAADAIKSGLAGESEPLRKFGVLLTEAKTQAEAYADGIAATGSKLTEAQKVQARYNLILKESSVAAGDYGRTAQSLPNQVRTLQAELKNTAAEFGEHLLPATKLGTQALLGLVQAAEGLPGPLKGGVAAVAGIGAAAGPALVAIGQISKGLESLSGASNVAKTALLGLQAVNFGPLLAAAAPIAAVAAALLLLKNAGNADSSKAVKQGADSFKELLDVASGSQSKLAFSALADNFLDLQKRVNDGAKGVNGAIEKAASGFNNTLKQIPVLDILGREDGSTLERNKKTLQGKIDVLVKDLATTRDVKTTVNLITEIKSKGGDPAAVIKGVIDATIKTLNETKDLKFAQTVEDEFTRAGIPVEALSGQIRRFQDVANGVSTSTTGISAAFETLTNDYIKLITAQAQVNDGVAGASPAAITAKRDIAALSTEIKRLSTEAGAAAGGAVGSSLKNAFDNASGGLERFLTGLVKTGLALRDDVSASLAYRKELQATIDANLNAAKAANDYADAQRQLTDDQNELLRLQGKGEAAAIDAAQKSLDAAKKKADEARAVQALTDARKNEQSVSVAADKAIAEARKKVNDEKAKTPKLERDIAQAQRDQISAQRTLTQAVKDQAAAQKAYDQIVGKIPASIDAVTDALNKQIDAHQALDLFTADNQVLQDEKTASDEKIAKLRERAPADQRIEVNRRSIAVRDAQRNKDAADAALARAKAGQSDESDSIAEQLKTETDAKQRAKLIEEFTQARQKAYASVPKLTDDVTSATDSLTEAQQNLADASSLGAEATAELNRELANNLRISQEIDKRKREDGPGLKKAVGTSDSDAKALVTPLDQQPQFQTDSPGGVQGRTARPKTAAEQAAQDALDSANTGLDNARNGQANADQGVLDAKAALAQNGADIKTLTAGVGDVIKKGSEDRAKAAQQTQQLIQDQKISAGQANLELRKAAVELQKVPGLIAAALTKVSNDILNSASKQAQDYLSGKTPTPGSLVRSTSGAGANSGGANPGGVAAAKLPGRADGGPVFSGQAYVVGEHRPEVFVPRTDGNIIPRIAPASATSTDMSETNGLLRQLVGVMSGGRSAPSFETMQSLSGSNRDFAKGWN